MNVRALRGRSLGITLATMALACSGSSSVVVVSVDAPTQLPTVSRIQVFLSNSGASDIRLYPPAHPETDGGAGRQTGPPPTLAFPTSFAIILDHTRPGPRKTTTHAT